LENLLAGRFENTTYQANKILTITNDVTMAVFFTPGPAFKTRAPQIAKKTN